MCVFWPVQISVRKLREKPSMNVFVLDFYCDFGMFVWCGVSCVVESVLESAFAISTGDWKNMNRFLQSFSALWFELVRL